ncbi:ferrichrome ABC transporter substrate-binding protein [Paenibacillus marchantiophytorum]|uniref:Ferrichrome ABC transporter substrate-binding protein n=1 Tax=Paenibacillus marchantiophytorum TaxID=1619310 RepID=A0ABQ1ETE5_9BACL|nr:ABC transporter substrate-binding protein [Paenibacillus marchantiophytorum]GFZ86414.1 ferrichrome ABC transporter substrate-binding protein [Paenibacillus marchantiophytorum]
MQLVKRIPQFVILALLVISLAACGTSNKADSNQVSSPAASNKETAAASSRTFKHVLGEMTLDKKPTRVFAPYAEDALLVLGMKPVLKWSLGDYVQEYLEPDLKEVKAIDYTGGPSVEAILASAPDLIFLESPEMASNGNYEKYSRIAPTYVMQDSEVDWQAKLRILGDLLDRKNEADKAIASYNSSAQTAKSKLTKMGGKTVAVVRVKPKDFMLMDGVHYSGKTLFNDLGLMPHAMVKSLGQESFASISLEKLPELDADYIFYMIQGAASEGKAKELFDSHFWKNLPAVKSGHAYLVDNSYWLAEGFKANTKQIEDIVKLIGDK